MQLWSGDQALPPRWTWWHRGMPTPSSASSRAFSKRRIACPVLACSMVHSVSTPMRWPCRRDGIPERRTRANSSSTRSPEVLSRRPSNGSECAARLWPPLSDLPSFVRLVALAGVATFIAVVVTLHFLQPGYDPSTQLMSELALGGYGGAMTVAFGGLAVA